MQAHDHYPLKEPTGAPLLAGLLAAALGVASVAAAAPEIRPTPEGQRLEKAYSGQLVAAREELALLFELGRFPANPATPKKENDGRALVGGFPNRRLLDKHV